MRQDEIPHGENSYGVTWQMRASAASLICFQGKLLDRWALCLQFQASIAASAMWYGIIKGKVMKDNLISSNVVASVAYRGPLDKYKATRQTMDADLVKSVGASMKGMLGNKQAIAVRVTAV